MSDAKEEVTSHDVDIDGLRLHYRSAGTGEVVLLLHGWPTSSYLWRHVMVPIAEHRRVIALDLPGFGRSDKPLDATYSFRYFSRMLDGFLAALEIEELDLAVHDLGGPVGLYWASRNRERVRRLALLNTLVYPEVSWAVVLFVLACRLPVLRSILSGPWGLQQAMRFGVGDASRLTAEVIREVQAPFRSREARAALLKAGSNLSPKGFREIAAWLPTVKFPVRVIYGRRDRVLPDVARTMRRVQGDVPQAEVTVLDDCGHFLQEERPGDVGRLLAEFFTS